MQGIIAEKKEKTVSNKPVLRKPHREAMPFVLFLLGILATVGMMVAFFLPYSVATGERLEILEEYADVVVDEDLDMTGADLESISLVEYGHIFVGRLGENAGLAVEAKIFLGFFAVEAVFLVLTAVFLLIKKYIPMLIFSVLLLGSDRIMDWLFRAGNFVPTENYSYSVGRYTCLIAAGVLVVCAIVLLVLKCSANRKSRNIPAPPVPAPVTETAEAGKSVEA